MAGRSLARLGLLLIGLAAAGGRAAAAQPGELRVCADPNNLPFSNAAREGFENKIAELVAGELGRQVSYTWWAQRRGYVRNTLKAGLCDVIIGVPAGLDMVETTRPYYGSTYVFVSRADRKLDLSSMTDSRLARLTVGVHLIGNDGFNTPPAHALGEQGIVSNVVGYTLYGDYRNANPPARLIEAVEKGDVDVAAAWGPLAGYFARRSPVRLRVVPITNTDGFAPFAFRYAIAMGVRKGDHALRAQLDAIIARKEPEIRAILESYGVPLVEPKEAEPH